MKINAKMMVYILSTSMFIFIISLGYIAFNSRTMALNDARESAEKTAREYSNAIKSELTADLEIAKTLAQISQAYSSLPWEQWLETFLIQQRNIINENPHYLAVATSWELSQVDATWNKDHGRILNGWVKANDGAISEIKKELNLEGDNKSSNYYKMKASGNMMIIDPKLYSPTGKVEDQYLNSNISVPIKLGNTFIGLTGMDVDLQRFQELIKKIKPFETGYSFILSNNGTFVGHPDVEIMGKKFNEKYPKLEDKHQVLQKIKKGIEFNFTYTDDADEKSFYVFAPIHVKGIDTPWSLAISVPYNVITANAQTLLLRAILVTLLGLLLLTIVIWYIARNISDPIV